jgi:hypothetical protein
MNRTHLVASAVILLLGGCSSSKDNASDSSISPTNDSGAAGSQPETYVPVAGDSGSVDTGENANPGSDTLRDTGVTNPRLEAGARIDANIDGGGIVADAPAAGGTGGTATGSGGRTGTGGSTGQGGSSGQDGGPAGGEGGSGGNTASNNCITHSARTSTAIATVGIVTWSSTLSGLKSAKIDFGLDTNYGMTAPVENPVAGSNTTLLLGMKPSKTYHFRITATGSDGDCVGPAATIQTGALLTGLPKLTVTTTDRTKLAGGFLLTGQYGSMSSTGQPAYIVDADGDMVWAYKFPKDATGAVMSYDGQWMWINSINVPSGTVTVQRVSMDGLTVQDKSSDLAGLNHQLTVLPDETVAFYAYNASADCADIKEYSPSGSVKTIVNAGTAQGGSSTCHLTNIQYSKEDDTLVFADLNSQVVVKIRRSNGSTVWVANGNRATLSGDTWRGGQFGLHLLASNRILIFNNNSTTMSGGTGGPIGDGSGSSALEFKLDLTANKIAKVWAYKSDVQTDILGDVQRTENGNTVIGFSTKGILREVDVSGTVVQELKWPLGTQFGYIQKRKTLYGPPPR